MWLEHPSHERDVWLAEQHALTAKQFADDDVAAQMADRIERLWDHTRIQVADIQAGEVFYYINHGDTGHYDLYSQPLTQFIALQHTAGGRQHGGDAHAWYQPSREPAASTLQAAQVSPSGERVALLLSTENADGARSTGWHVRARGDAPGRDAGHPIILDAAPLLWSDDGRHVYHATQHQLRRLQPEYPQDAQVLLEVPGVIVSLERTADYLLVGHYADTANGYRAQWQIADAQGRTLTQWPLPAAASTDVDEALGTGGMPAAGEEVPGREGSKLPEAPQVGTTAAEPLPSVAGCLAGACFFVESGPSGRGQLWRVPVPALPAGPVGSAAARVIVPTTDALMMQAAISGDTLWLHYLEDGSSVVRQFAVGDDGSISDAFRTWPAVCGKPADGDAGDGANDGCASHASKDEVNGSHRQTEERRQAVRVDFMRATEAGLLLSYSGLLTPPASVLLNNSPVTQRLLWQNSPALIAGDPEWSVMFRQVAAADGALLPVWLAGFGLDNLDGRRMLLEVYGGFGVPLELMHSITRSAWMEAGGVYAVAGPRGGGTYGADWHAAGRGENQATGVADVLTVAAKLGELAGQPVALMGASHGAMLAVAAAQQEPQRVAAVVAAAGVYDLLRYPELGGRWQQEYGDPQVASERVWLAARSPYHRALASAATPGDSWPPWLLVTRADDDVVNPAHSYKLHAARREGARNEDVSEDEASAASSLLYRVRGEGHTAAGQPADLIREYADRWSFVWRRTGGP